MKIFITGQPGVGKTTLLKKIDRFCRDIGLTTFGFITEEVREGKNRIGFDFINLKTNERYNFASIYKITPYKFGKYYLNIDKFEEIIEQIFYQEGDIFILDEIGRMEFYSEKFKKRILEYLERDKNIIASLHRDFVNIFKKYGKIYQLTYENRDLVLKEVEREILKNFNLDFLLK
ncbi:MAG: NTPase [Dictyoglomus sp.]|nr:NTPase [Dictyoglomus sp.]MCX7941769.1 NTPase [Dictyoglomaceae bacterium]MDW8188647.1 NTPase [Dictyoglomus sp.]